MKKIRVKDVTLKNIGYYFQGTGRKWLLDNFPGLIEPHIQEQFEYRINLIGKKSPKCLTENNCVICGCSTLEMAISDKICEGDCYPEMMDSETWEKFKIQNNIKNIK